MFFDRYITEFIAMTSLLVGAVYIFYFVKTCRHPRFNWGVFVPKIAQTSLCLQKIVDCRHEFIRAIRQERLSRDLRVAPGYRSYGISPSEFTLDQELI